MNTPHRGCQGFLWRQAVHPFIYLFIILIGFFLLGGKVYPATAAGTAALGEADALPAGLARPDEVTPLPTDCSGLALPGEDPPAACIYGYVYLDETPVLSATLTLHSGQGTLSLLTQMGSASESPYYAAALSGTPLSAQAGDLLTASVDFISQTNLSYFETRSGAQQVDLHLSSTCGHTQVGGVLSTDTHWTAACAPYLVTESLYVLDGVELSIDPGVTVLVSADQVIEVEGVLTAPGTSNAMIAFTSAEVAPAAGDWGSLLLTDLGAHLPADTLHYTLLEYSGGLSATDNGALRVNNAAPSLSHLTVRHSASDGVHFYNNAAGSIQASHIYQNAGWGLYFRSEALASTVSQVNLHHNQGGGAYYYSSAGTASLTDSTIANNQGIGVYVSQIAPGLAFNLERSTIQGNRKLSEGAGVYLGSLLACTVRDNAILDNVSSGNCAGIRFNYCTI